MLSPNNIITNGIERLKLKESTFLIFVSIIIGICAGSVFLAFHWLTDSISNLLLNSSTDSSVESFKRLPFYLKILIPLGGAFLSGIIIKFNKGSGDAGVGLLLKYIKVKNGIIPASIIFFKIITSRFQNS
jgi:H+/Cl- antiporter ClcA